MKWKDIKVGQKMKDGSVVTQVHKVHKEECCKVTYDNDREMECSFKHVFLIDVHMHICSIRRKLYSRM